MTELQTETVPRGTGTHELPAGTQTLFREVNQQLFGLGEVDEFVCECLDLKCHERIKLTRAEYQRVLGGRSHFAVAVGHVGFRRDERLVRGCDRYEVVEKLGVPLGRSVR
jgi:hypothetical protein